MQFIVDGIKFELVDTVNRRPMCTKDLIKFIKSDFHKWKSVEDCISSLKDKLDENVKTKKRLKMSSI